MFCLEKNYNRPPTKINIKIGFPLLVIPSWLQYCKHSTTLKTQLYCVLGMNDCYKYQKIPLLNYILHTMEAFIQRKYNIIINTQTTFRIEFEYNLKFLNQQAQHFTYSVGSLKCTTNKNCFYSLEKKRTRTFSILYKFPRTKTE